MGGRGSVLLVSFAVFAALFLPLHASADTEPPVFLEVGWTPKYAIHPDNITVYARVADPDGIALVTSSFCYFTRTSGWQCLYSDHADPDGDGNWTAVPKGPNATTTQPEPTIGGALQYIVYDTFGNFANTSKIWVLFVDYLTVTLDDAVLGAEPGQAVTVNGTVLYEANSTAPAAGVTVTVSVPGSTADAVVGPSGRFSANLTSPTAEGTYDVTATATDRTLTGEAEGVLAVSTVPRPDLRVGSVTPAHPLPVAGEPLSVTFQVQNVGTEDAVDAQVLVEVSRSGTWSTIYDETVTLAKGGDAKTLAAEFTPQEGVYTIRVRVDPGGAIDELNETNNEATATVSARAPDMPVLWIAAGGGIGGVALVGVALAVRRRRPRTAPNPSDKGKAF